MKYQSFLIMITTICTFIFFSSKCFGDENNFFVPWNFNSTHHKEPFDKSYEDHDLSLASHISINGIKFFIRYISKVDGDRCPMYPTCSSYSIEAIKKHGVLTGIVMTADRLIHENNEMDYAQIIKVGDRYRFYDPLYNNDFWWSEGKR